LKKYICDDLSPLIQRCFSTPFINILNILQSCEVRSQKSVETKNLFYNLFLLNFQVVSAQRCELIIVFRGTKTKEQLFLEGWQSLQPGVDFDGIYFLALLHHLLQHEQLNRKLEGLIYFLEY